MTESRPDADLVDDAHDAHDAQNAHDADLLAAFAKGDGRALGTLAARYEPLLLGVAYGMLGGDEAAARDAVQATWVKVIRHARSFQHKSAVKTWLYQILINECRTMRRRRNSLRVRNERDALSNADDKQVNATDEHVRLRRAVTALDDAAREAILLCYHHDMTREQAASVLEIPIGTLKTRLRAAKEQLRAILSDRDKAR